MDKNYFENLTHCRELLGVPEKTTIEFIKKRYSEELKKWHPDTCQKSKEECDEKIKEIIKAGKTLLNYCYKYPIDFSNKNIENLIPEEFWKRKFGEDHIWGKNE